MTAPDPMTVREIARTAGLMIVESVARDHIVHAAMAQHGIGHDNVYAWSETYDRVLDELAAVLKPLTQPDEQQPADVVTAEQQQDGAVEDVVAFLDAWEAAGLPDAVAHTARGSREGERPGIYRQELTVQMLRAVLAERTALATRVAELEGEREADTRAVAAFQAASGQGIGEIAAAGWALVERFADRAAALDVGADGSAE